MIEDNKFALTVHTRNVSSALFPRLDALLEGLLEEQPLLRRSEGRHVIELRPEVNWHKGRAVEWLLKNMCEQMGLPSGATERNKRVVPIYIGDDTSDEDAFNELRNRGVGIPIVVREEAPKARETAAEFWLRQREVADFLALFLHDQVLLRSASGGAAEGGDDDDDDDDDEEEEGGGNATEEDADEISAGEGSDTGAAGSELGAAGSWSDGAASSSTADAVRADSEVQAGAPQAEAELPSAVEGAAEEDPTEAEAVEGAAEEDPTEAEAVEITAEEDPTEAEAVEGTAEEDPTEAERDQHTMAPAANSRRSPRTAVGAAMGAARAALQSWRAVPRSGKQ